MAGQWKLLNISLVLLGQMMIVKALDVETTILNNGNVFDDRNQLCFVGIGDRVYDIEYTDDPFGEALIQVQNDIDEADLLLLINAKFDLHWLRKYGIKFDHKRIWDCQLVDFMLEGQTTSYPSMNSMAEKYNLPLKNDAIAEYWKAGICTKDIPKDEIVAYLQHDLTTTLAIYDKQKPLVDAKGVQFQRLVSLMHQDLIVLQDVEYNGLYFDEEMCLNKAIEQTSTIEELRMELNDYHNIDGFNTESGDHLSVLLYGGDIVIPRKELIGVYKTGDKKGLDKWGWKEYTYTLPRLFTPLKRTELKKEGYWATGESVLRQLKSRDKAAKRVIEIILTLAKLEKMVGTYYKGLPKLRETMNWKQNMLHGNLNQVTARTGRLSSTKPNLQNISTDMKSVFTTRYGE
jgi:DNA polymerase I-like protein with 3'-5' exonuclease and polymerase domains